MNRVLPSLLAILLAGAIDLDIASANDVQFHWDEGGVHEITVDGKSLFDGSRGRTGGIYVIGSLSGVDLGAGTVTSGHAPSGFLGPESPSRFPANKPLPPYTVRIRQMNDRRIRVYFEIGPVQTTYKSLDVAVDFGKGRMRSFDLGSDQYALQHPTDGDTIIPFPGDNFRALPQYFPIGDVGAVGEARRRAKRELINWSSAKGPLATVKISVLDSTHLQHITAANHFLTNNLGFKFGEMKPGDVARLRFYVTVTPR